MKIGPESIEMISFGSDTFQGQHFSDEMKAQPVKIVENDALIELREALKTGTLPGTITTQYTVVETPNKSLSPNTPSLSPAFSVPMGLRALQNTTTPPISELDISFEIK
jgi:hypothetical protein